MEQYIQPFIDVCRNVFSEFLKSDLVAERPHFSEKNANHECDISAVIGLTGEVCGAVVISMKLPLALHLTTILTGKEHTELDEDVADAVGEIVNIIAGNVKRTLEDAFKIVISLPSVIGGKNHNITWPHTDARIICIPFTIFEEESFYLSVAIEALNEA
jgi:chemotaxis protein CheX